MASVHPIAPTPIPALTVSDALGPDSGAVIPLYTCVEMGDGSRDEFEYRGTTTVAAHVRSQPWGKYVQHDFDNDEYGRMRALCVLIQGSI